MKSTSLKKGEIVIRAYAHEPEEWGVIVGFETVTVDPRNEAYPDDTVDMDKEYPIEYVYATVLWPGGYTTQEVDYELWTPEEAFEYAEKTLKELEAENSQQKD